MFLPGQSSPSIDNFLFGPYFLPETCVCTIVKKPAHFRFLGERIDETQFKMSEVCKNISAKKMFQDIQLCLQLFNSISPVCVPIKIMTLLDNFLFGPYFLPEFHLTICDMSSYPVILCPVTAVPLSKTTYLPVVPQCPSLQTFPNVPLSPAHDPLFPLQNFSDKYHDYSVMKKREPRSNQYSVLHFSLRSILMSPSCFDS